MGSEVGQSKRPWHRLHASTWIVLTLAIVVLVLLIVPGEIKETWGWLAAHVQHGWPWVYLSRRTNGFPGYAPGKPPWLIASGWNWSVDERLTIEPNPVFSLAMLLIDLAVAMAILVVLAFAIEWWRRRRRRLLQFYLSDGLICLLAMALLLGYWQKHNRRRLEIEQVMDRLPLDEAAPANAVVWEYSGPAWLRKLAGDGMLPRGFESVAAIRLNCSAASRADLSMLQSLTRLTLLDIDGVTDADAGNLAELPHLEFLNMAPHADVPITDASLPSLARLTNLRVLHITNSQIHDDAALQLRTLKRLERLSFGNNRLLTQSGLDALQLKLPHCQIEHWFEDGSTYEPASQ